MDNYLKYKKKYLNLKYGGVVPNPDLIEPVRAFNYFFNNSEIIRMKGGSNFVFKLKLDEGIQSPYIVFNSTNLGKKCTSVLVKIIILNSEESKENFQKEVNTQIKVSRESLEYLESISPSILYSSIYELDNPNRKIIIDKFKDKILETKVFGIIVMELLDNYISLEEYLKDANIYNKLIVFNMIGHSLIRLGQIGIIHDDFHLNNILINVTYDGYYDLNFKGKIQIIDFGICRNFKELTNTTLNDEFNKLLSIGDHIGAIHFLISNSKRYNLWEQENFTDYFIPQIYFDLKKSYEAQIEKIKKKYNFLPLEPNLLDVFLYYPDKSLILDKKILENDKIKQIKAIILINKKESVITTKSDLTNSLSLNNYEEYTSLFDDYTKSFGNADYDYDYDDIKKIMDLRSSLYLENDTTEDITLYKPVPIIRCYEGFDPKTAIPFKREKKTNFWESTGSTSSTNSGSTSSTNSWSTSSTNSGSTSSTNSGSTSSTNSESRFEAKPDYVYEFGKYDDDEYQLYIEPTTINKDLFFQPFQDNTTKILQINKFKRVIEIIVENDKDKDKDFIKLLKSLEQEGKFEGILQYDMSKIMVRIINRSYRNEDNTINYDKIKEDIQKFEKILKYIKN